MPSLAQEVLIIGTGGTIAGSASSGTDHVAYTAGTVRVETLISAVPPLQGMPLRFEQLAQLDSKDMDFSTWQRLVVGVQAAQDDAGIQGVVVTHGTDTLEETAFLLHHCVRGNKPVVLTAAMRPASALSADGPQNLLDAVTVARTAGVHGVLVCLAAAVHAGDAVRKVHTYAMDAFVSPDAGPLARVESGELRQLQPWRTPMGRAVVLPSDRLAWPRVEILVNAAGADGAVVPLLEALAQQEGRRLGLVAAGTGNGTLSRGLEAALLAAQSRGVAVLRTSRCAAGPVMGEGLLAHGGSLSPAQARVALLLQLLEA